MIQIYIKDIRMIAKNRPSGYIEDVMSHAHRVNNGIVYIAEDRYNKLCQKYAPKSPSLAKQALNFAKSATRHVAGGMKQVNKQAYLKRLEACQGCDRLQNDKCTECGCFVKIKAKWASESCPLDKWDNLPDPPKRGCGCSKKT